MKKSERFVGDMVVAGVNNKVKSLTQPSKKELHRHPFANKLTHLDKIHKHSDNVPLSHRLPGGHNDEGGHNEGDDTYVARVPGGPGADVVYEGRPEGDQANDSKMRVARKRRRGAHRGESKAQAKGASRERLTKGFRLDRKRITHVYLQWLRHHCLIVDSSLTHHCHR